MAQVRFIGCMQVMNTPDTPALPEQAASPQTTPAVRNRRPARRRPPRQTDGSERQAAPKREPRTTAQAAQADNPVLAQLAQQVPLLFGEQPLPLKRGMFEDLLAAFPVVLEPNSLKAALGLHVRSTRYLSAVAAGLPRHDLNGQAVEAPTPEQVHHALIEVFRRRGARSREDLRPKLRQRLLQAFEASGLSRDEYALRTHSRDEEVNQLTHDALAEAALRAAREDALLRTFKASGQPLEAFADMYGMPLPQARQTLERAQARLAREAPVQVPASVQQP